MTTTQNLAERLEELSKKAAPGPWRWDHRETNAGMFSTQAFDQGGETIATFAWYPVPHENGVRTNREDNAALITELVNNLPTILSALCIRDRVIEGDCVSRSEVLRICQELGSQSADLALYGASENARNREAMEAAATRIRCAVALMPTLSSHAETAGGWVLVAKNADGEVRAMMRLDGDNCLSVAETLREWHAVDAKRTLHLLPASAMIKAEKGGEI